MNILVFTLGTRGDVQPYVALASELQRRGHAVTFSTGAGFEALTHGLRTRPLSTDYRALLESSEAQEALSSLRGKVNAYRRFGAMLDTQLREMWEIANDVRPELIVYHPKAAAAVPIAVALNTIAVPTTLQPAFAVTREFPSIFLPVSDLGDVGNRMSHALFDRISNTILRRQSRRLEPLRAFANDTATFVAGHDPAGRTPPVLHGYSHALVSRPEDWPHQHHITGQWHSRPSDDYAPDVALERFLASGSPPIYVGFGSMVSQEAERLGAVVVEAIRRVGVRAIVALGWGGLKGLEATSDVHPIEHAPHDWLFPRCSIVVHHGGAGTTHEALRFGRPSIVCPLFGDQPFWGRRVAAVGAGPVPIPLGQVTVERLEQALRRAMQPDVAAAAARVSELMQRERGVEVAATLIEAMQ